MSTLMKNLASTCVVVAEPDTTALVLSQLMRQHHIGAVVVVDAQDKKRPVGIVTDRDLVLELMAEGLDPAVFTAGDIMSIDVVTAHAALDALAAVQLMQTHQVRRLIVTDDAGALSGIVTLDDVIEALAQQLASLSAALADARDLETQQRR